MKPLQREEFTMRNTPMYIFWGFSLVVLIVVVSTHQLAPIVYGVLAGSFVIPLLVFQVLKRNKIIIDQYGIAQQNVFGKLKEISWQDIRSSSVEWRRTGKSSTLYWDINSTNNKISFQCGMYGRKALRTIADALIESSPKASFDDRIKNFAAGKFPWYVF